MAQTAICDQFSTHAKRWLSPPRSTLVPASQETYVQFPPAGSPAATRHCTELRGAAIVLFALLVAAVACGPAARQSTASGAVLSAREVSGTVAAAVRATLQ